MVRAHEIESTIAIYPRIVINPFVDEIFGYLSKPKYKNLICKDFDGLYFFDIFYSDNPTVLPFVEELTCDNEKRIEARDQTNLKERQKLKWLQNYFMKKYDYLKTISANGR